MEPSTLPEMHDAKYFAAQLEIHPITLRRAVERGQLRAFKIGRSVRYDVTDVLAWWKTYRGRPRPVVESLSGEEA